MESAEEGELKDARVLAYATGRVELSVPEVRDSGRTARVRYWPY